MDELKMDDFLTDALHFYNQELEETDSIKNIKSFERAGFRYNRGLVITFADGSQFHLTIVQSEIARKQD